MALAGAVFEAGCCPAVAVLFLLPQIPIFRDRLQATLRASRCTERSQPQPGCTWLDEKSAGVSDARPQMLSSQAGKDEIRRTLTDETKLRLSPALH